MAEMDERLISYLDDCLAAMRAGASLESCLSRYPDDARELAALLRIALALEGLPQPGPAASTSHKAKNRFLATAKDRRAAVEPSTIRRRLANAWSHIKSRLGLKGALAPVRGLATAAIALALVLLVSAGVIYAASGSIPGDPLYGFKLLGEDVQRALTWSEDGRIHLETTLTQRRLDEVQQLLRMARQEDISFSGLLQARNGNDWVINNIPVTITSDTRLQSEPDIGAFVQIFGVTGTGGFVTAHQVGVEGDRIIGHIGWMLNDVWQVADRTIRVDDQTLIRNDYQTGDCVEVHTRRFSDDTQLALEIEPSVDCGQEESDEDGEPAQPPTATPTPVPTVTMTATSTPTQAPTPTTTAIPSPTATVTARPTPSATWTSTPPPTPTVSPTAPPEDDEPAATIQPPPTTPPPSPTPTATEDADDDDNDNDSGGNENGDDGENSSNDDNNDNDDNSDDGENSNSNDTENSDAGENSNSTDDENSNDADRSDSNDNGNSSENSLNGETN